MAKLTPMKAIRKKRLECSCGSFNEVKLCPIEKCPLYPYRFGHRPVQGRENPMTKTKLKTHKLGADF